jgi:hypothetical protein
VTPDAAAKRLLESARTTEPDPHGRIDIDQVSIVFLREGGRPNENRVGIPQLRTEGLIEVSQRRVLPHC